MLNPFRRFIERRRRRKRLKKIEDAMSQEVEDSLIRKLMEL